MQVVAPAAEYFPESQAVQARLVVAEQAVVWYVPVSQAVQAVQARFDVAVQAVVS